MIEIKEEHYIGEGTFQKCYIHPHNENLCIKIQKDGDARANREIKYYKKIQRKTKSKEISFYAKFHNEVLTNLGLGHIYDLVRDETTQKISLTIYDYLKKNNSLISDALISSELNVLKEKMIKNKVFVSDLTGKNICCKILKDNSMKLVVIDGIGHRDFIPTVEWFNFFARRKVNKVFNMKRLNSMDEHREFLEIKKLNQ